ncbi:hypothetical protein TNCV_4531011 [Trichonephila clavipes]|nr:hypothetical protein TNCV_4531011 [Trichonephila clavipes]
MDVCKCILPMCHGGTQNIRLAKSPLERLVEEEEGGGLYPRPAGYCPSKMGYNGAKPFCHLHGAQSCV